MGHHPHASSYFALYRFGRLSLDKDKAMAETGRKSYVSCVRRNNVVSLRYVGGRGDDKRFCGSYVGSGG